MDKFIVPREGCLVTQWCACRVTEVLVRILPLEGSDFSVVLPLGAKQLAHHPSHITLSNVNNCITICEFLSSLTNHDHSALNCLFCANYELLYLSYIVLPENVN